MVDAKVLHRFASKLDRLDRARVFESGEIPHGSDEPVCRANGSPIPLDALSSLKRTFDDRRRDFESRPKSDGWLAPRLHSALRLTRAQAADRGLWQWLAVVEWSDYVHWRWGEKSDVAENRWYGPINKQALARLWWGAELFRNGYNYTGVESAYLNQDFVNSYLHRPLVRCRSLALGIVEALKDEGLEGLTSKRINDLARVLNLTMAGSPPEAQVGFQFDDAEAALQWAREDPAAPHHWEDPLPGPVANDVTVTSVQHGSAIARHGMSLAGVHGGDPEDTTDDVSGEA